LGSRAILLVKGGDAELPNAGRIARINPEVGVEATESSTWATANLLRAKGFSLHARAKRVKVSSSTNWVERAPPGTLTCIVKAGVEVPTRTEVGGLMKETVGLWGGMRIDPPGLLPLLQALTFSLP
jgi:hypothetical protein